MRRVRADSAGTLVCRFLRDTADRTFNLAAGEPIDGAITHIRATSTATGAGFY